MAWYAVYDKVTKELISTGSVIEPAKLSANLEYVELPKEPDFSKERWDTSTLEIKENAIPEKMDKLDEIIRELLDIKALLQRGV